MQQSFLYDVFLSYGLKDRITVHRLAKKMEKSKLRVWFAEWEIIVGNQGNAKIEYGLENSRVMVFCFSANTHGSELAQMESMTFRFRDPLNKDRRFIILQLDNSKIKKSLTQFLHINWQEQDTEEYEKLLDACLALKKTIVPDKQTHIELNRKSFQLHNTSTVITYAFSKSRKQILTGDYDGIIKLWDIESKQYKRVLTGHEGWIQVIKWSEDEKFALSGGADCVIRLWDMRVGQCVARFKGHQKEISDVCWDDDGNIVSCSKDGTIRVWSIHNHKCLLCIEGRSDTKINRFYRIDDYLISGGESFVRIWSLKDGLFLLSLSGHTDIVTDIILSKNKKLAYSSSCDKTIRSWNIDTVQCLQVFEGHTDVIWRIALSSDEQFLASGDLHGVIRLWELSSGKCMHIIEVGGRIKHLEWWNDNRFIVTAFGDGTVSVWDVSIYTQKQEVEAKQLRQSYVNEVQYTNAKVLVVGESGAGKTGLTERLALNTFTPSFSTAGTWSTQWKMKGLSEEGWLREIWLWDFGGQADQRLIHQLFMDKTVLILQVFNADQETVIPTLRTWQQALSKHVPSETLTYIVAGRIDAGLRFSREKVQAFVQEFDYKYFETSANNGQGCDTLREAIVKGIPWQQLEKRTSPALWKILKDEILKLRDDEKQVLFTYKELRETLFQRVPQGTIFTDADLETVISLLDGPGVVKELNFGTYVLIRPEWINIYGQSVIRTLRADDKNIGCLPVSTINEANLIFQTEKEDEKIKEKRLSNRAEEQIVMQAMEQMLLGRQLCLRQEGKLIFPSYYGLEMPLGPTPPIYYISYRFSGYADDIYATLVVKLLYCRAFILDELWKDAANFRTLIGSKLMGIKLQRNEDGSSALLVHYDKSVTIEEKVIFANYIHGHLVEQASNVQRQRHFVHDKCNTPVRDLELAMERLEVNGKEANIICQKCEVRFKLWDALEDLFASDEIRKKVEKMQEEEIKELDTRRKGKLLALEVMARITSADQKCFEIPSVEDEGIDVEVEFTEDDGRGSGKRYYLQLKSGNSYLQKRKDNSEVFTIKKPQWVEYWLKQPFPVILVIGTFSETKLGNRKDRFEDVRWMEISELLRRETENGKYAITQFVFNGETLDTMAVRRWRDKVLKKQRL